MAKASCNLASAVWVSPCASKASASLRSSCAINSPSEGRCLSKNSRTLPSGKAPMKPSAGLPSLSKTQVGMLRMPKACESCCSSSELIFTNLKRPAYSTSSFSKMGPKDLHGPHHGAQKSTNTGTWVEAAITSASKLATVTSIMGVGSRGIKSAHQHAKAQTSLGILSTHKLTRSSLPLHHEPHSCRCGHGLQL